MTHICVGNLSIIGSDNGLAPGWRQANIWTSAGILLIGPLGTNFSEMLIRVKTFSFKKMHLKMSSAKWRPFCPDLNVLISFSRILDFSIMFLVIHTTINEVCPISSYLILIPLNHLIFPLIHIRVEWKQYNISSMDKKRTKQNICIISIVVCFCEIHCNFSIESDLFFWAVMCFYCGIAEKHANTEKRTMHRWYDLDHWQTYYHTEIFDG